LSIWIKSIVAFERNKTKSIGGEATEEQSFISAACPHACCRMQLIIAVVQTGKQQESPDLLKSRARRVSLCVYPYVRGARWKPPVADSAPPDLYASIISSRDRSDFVVDSTDDLPFVLLSLAGQNNETICKISYPSL
jgi:hypothetical protein